MNEDALGFIKGQPGLIALIIYLATTVILSFGLPKMIEDNPVAG
jgi:hypothetical protein